jgi:hypothetical protein
VKSKSFFSHSSPGAAGWVTGSSSQALKTPMLSTQLVPSPPPPSFLCFSCTPLPDFNFSVKFPQSCLCLQSSFLVCKVPQLHIQPTQT